MKQNRRLSQVFLTDKSVLQKEASEINPSGKSVLEIGCGNGALTAKLLALSPKSLLGVEIDQRFAGLLKSRYSSIRNFNLIQADFLELNPKEHGHLDIICGNIPYYLTSDILFRLREWDFKKAFLLVQKEVVERVVDDFADCTYSRLNIMANYYFECSKGMIVPKSCFSPVPMVDSQLLVMEKRKAKHDPGFELFVRNLFTHQKKTLRNAVVDSYDEFGFESKHSAREFADSLEFRDERVFHMNIACLLLTYKQFGKLRGHSTSEK